jgi:hypothetical protein
MKPILNLLTVVFPLPVLINLALLTPFVVCLLASFLQYYKIMPARKHLMQTLEKMNNEGIKFIVHADQHVFCLKNIDLKECQISGDREALSAEYLEFLDPKTDDRDILTNIKNEMGRKEVHLYTDNASLNETKIVLTDNQIRAIHVYEPGKKTTGKVRAMQIAEVVVSIAAVLGAIIVACSITWYAIRVI